MSTASLTPATALGPARRISPLGRILNAAKLQFTNPATLFFIPWMIMALVLLLNLGIWALVLIAAGANSSEGVSEGAMYNGGSWFLFVYMLVVAVQAVNLTFPFAQGYSVTRRDFYLGTSLAFVAVSALNAVLYTLLKAVEEATGGWWLGGGFFSTLWYGDAWWETLLITFLLFLFFIFVGAAVATMYLRWRVYGLLGFFTVLALVIMGGLFLIGLTNSWVAVGGWFVANGPLGVALWSMPVAAVAAVAGFLLLRRATPRN